MKGISCDDQYLRNRLIRIYGRPAVNELALAVATARVFPALKWGMGRAQTCRVPAVGKKQEITTATANWRRVKSFRGWLVGVGREF